MKKIIDISLSISPSLPVWPGDPPIKLGRLSKIEQGDPVNITHISMGAHTGTHVDAPYHFFDGEAVTTDQLSLELLTGQAYVVRIPDSEDLITTEVLRSLNFPTDTKRLLFRTRNSELWSLEAGNFIEDFVAIAPDAARYLVDLGVKTIGVDYHSVAPFSDTIPTHRILLGSGVVIIEGLDLSQVDSGFYELYCLPVKLAGADGAPARAILVESTAA